MKRKKPYIAVDGRKDNEVKVKKKDKEEVFHESYSKLCSKLYVPHSRKKT